MPREAAGELRDRWGCGRLTVSRKYRGLGPPAADESAMMPSAPALGRPWRQHHRKQTRRLGWAVVRPGAKAATIARSCAVFPGPGVDDILLDVPDRGAGGQRNGGRDGRGADERGWVLPDVAHDGRRAEDRAAVTPQRFGQRGRDHDALILNGQVDAGPAPSGEHPDAVAVIDHEHIVLPQEPEQPGDRSQRSISSEHTIGEDCRGVGAEMIEQPTRIGGVSARRCGAGAPTPDRTCRERWARSSTRAWRTRRASAWQRARFAVSSGTITASGCRSRRHRSRSRASWASVLPVVTRDAVVESPNRSRPVLAASRTAGGGWPR